MYEESNFRNTEHIISSHKLTRKKSFSKLPRFQSRRCRGFRFRRRLRRLGIVMGGMEGNNHHCLWETSENSLSHFTDIFKHECMSC